MIANITAIVLTHNEVGNLGRCFASLRWCDEIVVVDSGSTDGTQNKAAELGARVIEHQTSPFIIAEQRNWALDNAEIATQWVLFLDADEVVPPALAAELQRVSADLSCSFDAFVLTPRYLFWGKWLKRTQGFPNWHPRFLRLGYARYSGGVWEHFSPGARVSTISVPYDHFANSKGLSDWLWRHDRYSTWDAQRVVDFVMTRRHEALGTARKPRLRALAAHAWPLRPWARYFQMYFLRLGFLEGAAAFVFCLLYFFYEWMIVIKIVELRRAERGLPL